MTERPIGERVAALEAVLPGISRDIGEIKDMLIKRFEEQDKRIGSLERLRYWLAGAAAAIGLFAGLIWDLFRGRMN